ncbi:DEAD/DEAH box helicase family protein [Argonema antarcticum]|uniref:DEAD/DEAH box helicase family protein n=1 Tax=Argonema antarcticum TaxID=2942763 RepID=UPI0020134777|nr:DEAD/DEAH box helicase family protein [Argonema antarcticum]MCL1470977.1 DEAD/DEAH box helicase family protein [Argonema antarcticum A004/B2]
MPKESRFLRSKKLRAALWYAADGKCQWCGCDLPSDWHADHTERWAETKRTNVHEMEALCPKCHYKKTGEENRNMTSAIQLELFEQPPKEPLNLRKHQAEFLQICKLIKAGTAVKKIILLVTPGGGKSLIPVIAAAQLLPNRAAGGGFHETIADAICWVVPRLNLQKQAEDNFENSYFKDQLGHQHRIMANNNEPNPCKGMSGYVATYQAIGANPDLHAQELRRKRYILVLDEFHHVEEDGAWHRALQPLVDSAVLVILVTGTHQRGDGKPIAFMPYKEITGGVTPNLSSNQETKVIEYTRSQALREGAIVPLHFEWGDGEAKWIDQKGQECSVESLAEAGDYTGIALRTALSTGYAHQLLTRCVENWKSHKIINQRSKLLVIAPKIKQANQYMEWLKELGIKAIKATSDQSKDAQAAIKKFKKHYPIGDQKAVDVLVTVAMAYEGLDVPAITHIACLTQFRTVPWLEQAWARAARVDDQPGALKNKGHIYIPDDELARKCVGKIIAEQEPIIKEKEEKIREERSGSKGDNELLGDQLRDNSIIPLYSNLTRSRASDLSNGETIDYAETARIQSARQNAGLCGSSTIQLKRFIEGYLNGQTQDQSVAVKEPFTPSEERDVMRDNIEKYVRRYAAKNGIDFKTLNGEIVKFFDKSRTAMTLEELRQVWAWLQSNYPMND